MDKNTNSKPKTAQQWINHFEQKERSEHTVSKSTRDYVYKKLGIKKLD